MKEFGEDGMFTEEGSEADMNGKYWLYKELIKIGYTDEEAVNSMQLTPELLVELKVNYGPKGNLD